MSVKTFRLAVWFLIGLSVATLTYLSLRGPGGAALGFGTTADATVTFGGPFSMTAHTGETVSEKTYAGRPWMMFVGFTYCPEICPTTLAEMTTWYQELGADAQDLRGFLISVDPERDTVEALSRYMSSFDSRIVALRPSPAELERFTKAYKIYYKKVDTGDGTYTMDHTAGVLLFDREGLFAGAIDLQEPRKTALQKLRRLVAGGLDS